MGRPRSTENKFLPDNLRPKKAVRKSGKIVTYWLYRTHGKTEISFGKDRHQALIKAAQMNLERVNKKGVITFSDVVRRYKEEILPTKKPNTARGNLVCLKPLLAFFSTAPLDDIQPKHIREYLDRRKSTPAAANNEMGLFSHIWNTAREWGYTRLSSPSDGIKKYPIVKRDVYVDDHIYGLVYDNADQDMKDLMDIAYLTGQRPVDVVSIHRDQIHDGYLHIQQQKTRAKLRIEVVGKLAEIITRRLHGKNRYLFYSKKGLPLTSVQLNSLFKKVRLHTIQAHPEYEDQIKNFQFRDLRAKSGTDKAMSQGEEAARQQLGHTSVKMTKTYIRKAPIVTPFLTPPSNSK